MICAHRTGSQICEPICKQIKLLSLRSRTIENRSSMKRMRATQVIPPLPPKKKGEGGVKSKEKKVQACHSLWLIPRNGERKKRPSLLARYTRSVTSFRKQTFLWLTSWRKSCYDRRSLGCVTLDVREWRATVSDRMHQPREHHRYTQFEIWQQHARIYDACRQRQHYAWWTDQRGFGGNPRSLRWWQVISFNWYLRNSKVRLRTLEEKDRPKSSTVGAE